MRSFHQPYMTINSSAFIEPSFEFRGVDADSNCVPAAIVRHIGDVVTERSVASRLSSDEAVIHIHEAVAINAAKLNPDALAFIFFWQAEGAAIPSNAVFGEVRPDRFKSVIGWGIPIKGKRHCPIVW